MMVKVFTKKLLDENGESVSEIWFTDEVDNIEDSWLVPDELEQRLIEAYKKVKEIEEEIYSWRKE